MYRTDFTLINQAWKLILIINFKTMSKAQQLKDKHGTCWMQNLRMV